MPANQRSANSMSGSLEAGLFVDGGVERFISRDVPAGHDTIWGWAAKWAPGDLTRLVDLARAFELETSELLAQSAACGYSVFEVEAPEALRALGAKSVQAFDKQLLFMMARS